MSAAAKSPFSLPRQLVRTRRFTLGAPSSFTIAPDGRSVLFLRSRSGTDPDACLWTFDLDSGRERLLVDPHELLAGSGDAAGIDAYTTDDRVRQVAFELAGGLWCVELENETITRLPADDVVDPRPDPTGSRIAYVSAGALHVINTDGTGGQVIAAPDGPDVKFGIPEHVATHSMGGTRGFWWAPDGTRVLVSRVDESAVTTWWITDPSDPTRAPRAVRYPPAGTSNADVSLWIIGVGGERTEVRWDRSAFEYVVAAGWDADGPFAAVQSRDQCTVQTLAIDPDDGGTRLLAEQRDRAWVQLVPGTPVRTASGALVAHADRGDTRHLTVDGTMVTPDGLQLREVVGVDGDEVLFRASTDPTEIHLWSYAPSTGLTQETAEPGVHTGVRRAGTQVLIAERTDRPGTQVTVVAANRPALTIDSAAEVPVIPLRSIMLTTTERQLRSQLLLPSWHRPGDPALPVLLDPYGGPAMQRVTTGQTPLTYVAQWFAEQGFAVLVTDGSGTPGRGPAWEREVHGDLLSTVLDDQVAALRETARRHPELHLDRVGIRGWSYGGTLAAAAVLRRPDVFRAAVAGAGPFDQRMYDTHWRERFLGHPATYPHRYDASSLTLEAANLTRPLLLIHGLADDNVFPAHTLRLSSALVAAGRPHEVLLLARSGHRPADETVFEQMLLHQVGFLHRHLDPPAALSSEATRT